MKRDGEWKSFCSLVCLGEMKNKKFNQDCKTFEKLIKEGKKISEGARPISGHGNYISNAEQKGHAWYIKSRNFLSKLFGENFRDLDTFRRCFGKYHAKGLLMNDYRGSFTFVKEDIEKGVGVLEGTYDSFKGEQIKRRNKTLIFLVNFYYEIKDWGKIAGGIIKKPFT